MTQDEKIELLEGLIAKLASIIAEFGEDYPKDAVSALSEWLDYAVDWNDEIGWYVKYPKQDGNQ